ncbi:MAG: VOC family protein [Proteobacteria bacterium]|nr:VOC family protein [Pseudomonadota bacterium]
MNHLEHINLVVKDIKKSLEFYQAAFPHWSIRGEGEGAWYGKPRTWLHFGDDYQYIAFADDGVGNNRNLKGHQVGLAHFAYVTSNIKDLVNRLSKAGYEPSVALDLETYSEKGNVYYVDNDGFEIEFVQYFSDQPDIRNQYD